MISGPCGYKRLNSLNFKGKLNYLPHCNYRQYDGHRYGLNGRSKSIKRRLLRGESAMSRPMMLERIPITGEGMGRTIRVHSKCKQHLFRMLEIAHRAPEKHGRFSSTRSHIE